jgi:hypothetical protein
VIAKSQESWCDISIDAEHTMIYGPRFGRLYLLPPDQARGPAFLRAVGLAGVERVDGLPDPAERVLRNRTHFTGVATAGTPHLRAAYRVFRASRGALPPRYAGPVIRSLAKREWGVDGDPESIARTLHAVERQVAQPDCYPRALLTALLSLAAGQASTIVLGVLAPTRLMHVWCCVDGVLPYEPSPEHHNYQPLWKQSLTP